MQKNMFYYAEPLIFQLAKKLRNHLTNAAMKLWGFLPSKPFGYKFRRQHPIGCFVADFYCHAMHLVMEADGPVHEQEGIKKADIERQQSIEADGIWVIRFTKVANHFEAIISSFNAILQKKDLLTPHSGNWGVLP